MKNKTAVVVTSISAPNRVLKAIALDCLNRGIPFYVIGDAASPKNFSLEGCDFYSLEDQQTLNFSFARACPSRHYARKNIGYLLAIRGGAESILETDDDNIPYPQFWEHRNQNVTGYILSNRGWVNIYRYFANSFIWPRGLPLNRVKDPVPSVNSLSTGTLNCPIQQGLANENPDVDAIFRLTLDLPFSFSSQKKNMILSGTSWCPFNSQNTRWWKDAFPLLYLPSYCSFRMTDIWRGFVALRILQANCWGLLFHEPTVWQERNDHDLMKDFSSEIPGYLNNENMISELEKLPIKAGSLHIGDNLRLCYAKLIEKQWVGSEEMDLLNAWLSDLDQLR